jgi:hypothetical protein
MAVEQLCRRRGRLLGGVTASLFLLTIPGSARADLCTLVNPLTAVTTIGKGQGQNQNQKVSHEIRGHVIRPDSVGPRDNRVRVCVGSSVRILVTDTTGGPVIDLPANSALSCMSGPGPGQATCMGPVSNRQRYRARSQDGGDIDRMTVLPHAIKPPPCGDHECVLDPSSELEIVTQQGASVFPLTGAVDILCGTAEPDADGVCHCDASLRFLDPIEIPSVGTVCLNALPVACGSGLIDCDGGSDLDADRAHFHNIGTCVGTLDCSDQCNAHCASLGMAKIGGGCEGFCADASTPCTSDSDCLPSDRCLGTEPVTHSGVCGCLCEALGDGVVDGAGAAFLSMDVELVVEGAPPCGDGDILARGVPLCARLTTEAATGLIDAANNVSGEQIGPLSETGSPFVCQELFTGVTTGVELRASISLTDSLIGDFVARARMNCQ